MSDIVVINIPGEGVPFARAGGGKNVPRHTPPKQRSAMAQAGIIAAAAMRGRAPFEGPVRMDARFTYLPPKNQTKAQAACQWKKTKPDVDNLVKLLKDAFNKIVWNDDARVAELLVQKKYGPVASVVVTVMELPMSTLSTGLAQAEGQTGGASAPPSFPGSQSIATGQPS